MPPSVTDEMIHKFMGLDHDPYINIKLCAACPACKAINPKRGKANLLVCLNQDCKQMFCYICNKAVKGEEHFKQSNCHANSEVWTDL